MRIARKGMYCEIYCTQRWRTATVSFGSFGGTANLAGTFAEAFDKRDWGYCCGMLHDIGKYSDEFQKKIQTESDDRLITRLPVHRSVRKKVGFIRY